MLPPTHRTHHGAGPPSKTHRAGWPPQCQLQEKTGDTEKQAGVRVLTGGAQPCRKGPAGTDEAGSLCGRRSEGAPGTWHLGSSGASEPTTNSMEAAQVDPGGGVPYPQGCRPPPSSPASAHTRRAGLSPSLPGVNLKRSLPLGSSGCERHLCTHAPGQHFIVPQDTAGTRWQPGSDWGPPGGEVSTSQMRGLLEPQPPAGLAQTPVQGRSRPDTRPRLCQPSPCPAQSMTTPLSAIAQLSLLSQKDLFSSCPMTQFPPFSFWKRFVSMMKSCKPPTHLASMKTEKKASRPGPVSHSRRGQCGLSRTTRHHADNLFHGNSHTLSRPGIICAFGSLTSPPLCQSHIDAAQQGLP